MVDIEKLAPQIVKRLKPLNVDKIILFGSYAHGNPKEDSDIDLFLVNDQDVEAEALMRLRDIMKREKIGFDIICDSRSNIESKEDYFYKVEILQKGKLLYAQ